MNKKVYAFALLAILTSVLVASIETPEPTLNLKVTDTKILDSGDGQIHGSTYYNNSLWFSTRTYPAQILKMNADTLEYEKIVLDAGLNDGADLIEAQGKIWVILCQYKTKVIVVDPITLSWTVAVELPFSRGGSLLYDFGYLWAGGAGKLARINTSDYSYTVYEYPTSNHNQFHALTSGNGFLWGSCPDSDPIHTVIFRINPENPLDCDSITIEKIVTDDMTYLDALYVGTENPLSISYTYKIYDNLTYIPTSTQREVLCYGIFQNDGFLWAAYTGSPGMISVFDSELNLKGIYRLPQGFNDANEIVFDGNGYAYITCFSLPGRVVKIQYNNASL